MNLGKVFGNRVGRLRVRKKARDQVQTEVGHN